MEDDIYKGEPLEDYEDFGPWDEVQPDNICECSLKGEEPIWTWDEERLLWVCLKCGEVQ